MELRRGRSCDATGQQPAAPGEPRVSTRDTWSEGSPPVARCASPLSRCVPEDREFAERVLQGWRVRLAAVRTEKRMADDAAPLEHDLQLLEAATE